MIEYFVPSAQWTTVLWGNSLGLYTNALITFIGLGLTFLIIEKLILKRLQKLVAASKSHFDDALLNAFTRIRPPFYWFIAFYFSVSTLEIGTIFGKGMFVIVVLLFAWQIISAIKGLIGYAAGKALGDAETDPHVQSAVTLLSSLVSIALWILTILIILTHFGVDVTSLIAGLGIGGIAVAFAVKGILEDLFSSFSIYFDKPFMVGDMIEVDGEKGIVKQIGIKSTRLKSLGTGEEIVMSNTDLTTMKIRNYRNMPERRVSFEIGVTYETPLDLRDKIPILIEEAIVGKADLRFERVHLRSFDSFAVTYTALYHVTTRDYLTYLDVHQAILTAIAQKFEKEGIEMAYPTQTIHMAK